MPKKASQEKKTVRHTITNRTGTIMGTTTELGHERVIVRWSNGQISHVSDEHLQPA